jgi:hypothetical protein
MKALAQLPSHLSFRNTLELTALVAVAMVVTACSSSVEPNVQPPATTRMKAYSCKDRPITVDKGFSKGVDKETVVVCGGYSVSWKGNNPKDSWEVDFTTSPFVNGETVIKNGSPNPSPVVATVDDTAFKYSVITSDGIKHDPQIIIMGGGS